MDELSPSIYLSIWGLTCAFALVCHVPPCPHPLCPHPADLDGDGAVGRLPPEGRHVTRPEGSRSAASPRPDPLASVGLAARDRSPGHRVDQISNPAHMKVMNVNTTTTCASCATPPRPVCPVLDALGIALDCDPGALARALQRLLALDPATIRASATPIAEISPIGAPLLAAVRDALAGGEAYLVPWLPKRPVDVPADVYGRLDLGIDLDRALGWHDGAPAPGANAIGLLTRIRRTGSPLHGAVVALLTPTPAFMAAAQAGYDQAESGAAWSAVWDEGLAVPETAAWKRNTDRYDRQRPEVRVRLGGGHIRAVPVLVDTLLDETSG